MNRLLIMLLALTVGGCLATRDDLATLRAELQGPCRGACESSAQFARIEARLDAIEEQSRTLQALIDARATHAELVTATRDLTSSIADARAELSRRVGEHDQTIQGLTRTASVLDSVSHQIAARLDAEDQEAIAWTGLPNATAELLALSRGALASGDWLRAHNVALVIVVDPDTRQDVHVRGAILAAVSAAALESRTRGLTYLTQLFEADPLVAIPSDAYADVATLIQRVPSRRAGVCRLAATRARRVADTSEHGAMTPLLVECDVSSRASTRR